MTPRLLTLGATLGFAAVIYAAEPGSVSMLVPGFTARELPVRISNINNLRFTEKGELTALGYDGRIRILSDKDGDGLPETIRMFWDKQTLSVPVGMAWSPNGLYVTSKGKLSLLKDTNGDGAAEVEEIIASGWPPTDVGSGGVDATAVTLDREGNVYFGLLVADYSNPYRVKDGVSHYDLKSQRGTIQKWNAAAKSLETIATGIRVPYTLAFNRAGDLFLTDQEGETWCPEGNPLDELNHIIPGKNYGFPPRHEKYLPDLISEPPVIGFGPQHQSTCGFVFNESSPKQKRFGPPSWEGDVLVAGESRGKIWRARLVKTAAGYVGTETLIARVDMLVTDVAISPGGDLYISCHSGPPDWGTGPNGIGKLFKISYTDPTAPQPSAIWVSDPMTVSVAFDRPITPEMTNRVGEMKIEFGEYVSAADGLETLKPPYKVVAEQAAAPRGKLKVVSAKLSADRRTLRLEAGPHSLAVRYALQMPGYDLAYGLSGVHAEWLSSNGSEPEWIGWLPHFDLSVSQKWTAESSEHNRLWELIKMPGILRLSGRLAPGLKFAGAGATNEVHLISTRTPIQLSTAPTHTSSLDPTPRAISPDSVFLPWAQTPSKRNVSSEILQITGGDYERGRDLFFGERLKCSTCHSIREERARNGPALNNTPQRDLAAVLRDIREPSAMINPDYVGYEVLLNDGEQFTGFVRINSAETLTLVEITGTERSFKRSDVKSVRPSALSLMPVGLLDGLKEGEVRDLMTFLMHEPPKRSVHEAAKIPAKPGVALLGSKPMKLVLVASKQDHGPGQHDYPNWQKSWADSLAKEGLTVSQAWEWPTAEQWAGADVVALYFWNHNWSDARYAELDSFLNRGGGLAVFHSATIADREPEKLARRIGLAAMPGPTKYLHTPFSLEFAAREHPITFGFKTLELLDEPYWPMIGDAKQVKPLAVAEIDGAKRPLIWTFEPGKGRVFVSIVGHYTWTFDDPVFALLAKRGISWAAGD